MLGLLAAGEGMISAALVVTMVGERTLLFIRKVITNYIASTRRKKHEAKSGEFWV